MSSTELMAIRATLNDLITQVDQLIAEAGPNQRIRIIQTTVDEINEHNLTTASLYTWIQARFSRAGLKCPNHAEMKGTLLNLGYSPVRRSDGIHWFPNHAHPSSPAASPTPPRSPS